MDFNSLVDEVQCCDRINIPCKISKCFSIKQAPNTALTNAGVSIAQSLSQQVLKCFLQVGYQGSVSEGDEIALVHFSRNDTSGSEF